LCIKSSAAQRQRNEPDHFVFPSRLYHGQRALDLGAVLKRKIRPAFEKLGISGVGWHTFRRTVGTLLAELGEHQLTIRDYLRHNNLSVTNKYLQAASNTKRTAQAKLVEAILPVEMRVTTIAEIVAPLLHPNKAAAKLQVFEKNGAPERS
jgi:integrase